MMQKSKYRRKHKRNILMLLVAKLGIFLCSFFVFFRKLHLRVSLPLQPMKIGCQVTFVWILFLI